MFYHSPYKGRPYLLISVLLVFCAAHILIQCHSEHVWDQLCDWVYHAQKTKLEAHDLSSKHLQDIIEQSLAKSLKTIFRVQNIQGRCTIESPISDETLLCEPKELSNTLSFIPGELRNILDGKSLVLIHKISFSFSPHHVHLDRLDIPK